jgi:hypothetical protein
VVALEVVDPAEDGAIGTPCPPDEVQERQGAPTRPVSCVLAPAASATGVREELLLTENPWKRPAAALAAPSATSSWFGFTR